MQDAQLVVSTVNCQATHHNMHTDKYLAACPSYLLRSCEDGMATRDLHKAGSPGALLLNLFSDLTQIWQQSTSHACM